MIPTGTIKLTGISPASHSPQDTQIYQIVPYLPQNKDQWLRELTNVVNNIMTGKTNNTGFVTLAPSSTTTVVSLAAGKLASNSVIILMPMTANAAAENPYILEGDKDIINKQFTITHANAATTDRKYRYAIIG